MSLRLLQNQSVLQVSNGLDTFLVIHFLACQGNSNSSSGSDFPASSLNVQVMLCALQHSRAMHRIDHGPGSLPGHDPLLLQVL